MKKPLFPCLILCCSSLFALPLQKLVPAGSWVYDSVRVIAEESGEVTLAESSPLSVAELKRYLYTIDPQKLSSSGVREYDRVLAYFDSSLPLSWKPGIFDFSAGASCTPEFYYKSDPDIDWSFHYYYRDNLLSFPLVMGIGDYAACESDFFIGKNWFSTDLPDNFCNVPLHENDFEFLWPRTAYFSTGFAVNGQQCVSFRIGRGPMDAGLTQTGSIIMSRYFETEAYAELSLFIPQFRYTADIIQVDVDRYLYLHRVDIHPFRWFQIGCMEGALINKPLELRYMNPFMILHSMAYWHSYDAVSDYGESDSCAYLCFDADAALGKYVRLYGLYAQNEIQMPWETQGTAGKTIPNSLGCQIGIDVDVPSNRDGYWYGGLEGLYTTPWLYIKQTPDWSLYRARKDELVSGDRTVNTWMGTQFGPDSIVAQLRAGYRKTGVWLAEFQYLFAVQGKNSQFSIFDVKDGDGNYRYYPSTGYHHQLSPEEAIALAQDTTPTGTAQFTNRVLVKGEYAFTPWLTCAAQASFAAVSNCGHIEHNFRCGTELALSVSFSLM